MKRVIISAILAIIAGYLAFRAVPKALPELSREEFLAEVQQGHISKITIEDEDTILGESSTKGSFRSKFNRTADADLPQKLRAMGIEVKFDKSPLGLI